MIYHIWKLEKIFDRHISIGYFLIENIPNKITTRHDT